jgi:hypothetical protein
MNYIDISDADINFNGNGIINCTNSCFFNSINQMLFHIVEFREFMINSKEILSYSFDDDILLSLAGLFEKMKIGNIIKRDDVLVEERRGKLDKMINPITLHDFYQKIQNKLTGSNSYSQQDAGEVIERIYINEFDIYLNKIKLLLPSKGITNKYMFLNEINIDFPFLNFINRTIKKTICINSINTGKVYDTIEHETYYDIYFNKTNNRFNLEFKMKTSEYLDPEYSFNECKKDKDDITINTLEEKYYNFNKYLIVRLKRYEFTKETKIIKKKDEPIYIDSEILNIKNSNIINGYELIGSVCHNGPYGGGHYWYIHKVNNIWNKYDDPSFTHNISSQSSNEMYLLLFRKISENPYRLNQSLKFNLIDNINDNILDNLQNFYFRDVDQKNDKIIENYIKILAYYSNVYNKKNNINFDSKLLIIIQNLINRLKPLLI